jgi:hypothetical protein
MLTQPKLLRHYVPILTSPAFQTLTQLLLYHTSGNIIQSLTDF